MLVKISSVDKVCCILIAGSEDSLDHEVAMLPSSSDVAMSKFEKVAQEQDNVLLLKFNTIV